jgi:predicted ATPase
MINQWVNSRYRIYGELGQGGMGVVYLAEDVQHNRPVAIKMVPQEFLNDPDIVARFLREASISMLLKHESVTTVYEIGDCDQGKFICREYVDGVTLRDYLSAGPINLTEILDIGIRLAEALAHAHQEGIIHRDVKPENIMITQQGKLKLMDFGIARLIESSQAAICGEVSGTFAYMSPQQAIGEEVDHRTDIFSLGIVLYELVTGRRPFHGDDPMELVYSLVNEDPMRISELDENVPVEVELCIFKALQKYPQERYQSGEEMAEDLREVRRYLRGTIEKPRLKATRRVFREQARGVYSDFVNREPETEQLEWILTDVLRGKGQTVLISGEAGIGKSRLVWEVANRARNTKVRFLIGQCYPEGGVPYYPFLEVIQHYFRIKHAETMDDIKNLLSQYSAHLVDRVPVIQAFLGIPDHDGYAPLSREQVWDMVNELLMLIANERPAVIQFDDIHWADADTLGLFHYVARNTRESRVLLVCTFRPEETIGNGGAPSPLLQAKRLLEEEGLCHEIDLDRLGRSETNLIIRSAYPGPPSTSMLGETIYQETEGNPLFILETLKLLQDDGILFKDEAGWSVQDDVTQIRLPERIKDVVMQRLERVLPDEWKILELGSVEGLAFQSETIGECLEIDRVQLLLMLQSLEHQHRLIHFREGKYRFDHRQIQEVLYQGLSSERRHEYHRLIGTHMAETHADHSERIAAAARHLWAAEEYQKALPYLRRAGDKARMVYANEDANDFYTKAIQALDRMEPTPGAQRERCHILIGLSRLYDVMGKQDEEEDALRKALELAENLGDESIQAEVQEQLAGFLSNRGSLSESEELARRALRSMRSLGNRAGEGTALLRLGAVAWQLADHEQSRRYYQRALQAVREAGDVASEGMVLMYLGNSWVYTSGYRRALQYYEEALACFQKVGDKRGEGAVLGNMGVSHSRLGDLDKGAEYLTAQLTIKRAIGDRKGEASGWHNLAILEGKRGDYYRALSYYQTALSIWRQTDSKSQQARVLGSIGTLYKEVGCYEKALDHYKKALACVRDLDRRRSEAAVKLNNMGEIYSAMGNYDRAMKLQERALALAQELGMWHLVAAAQIGLTRIHRLRMDSEHDLRVARRRIKDAKEVVDRFGLFELKVETLSEHAMVRLTMGDRQSALSLSEQAIRLLGDKMCSGTLKERVFYHHSRILAANGMMESSRSYLRKGVEHVVVRSRSLKRKAERESFRQRVPLSREILSQWKSQRSP